MKEDVTYVRITKPCLKNRVWYNGLIGATIQVQEDEEFPDNWHVTGTDGYLIRKEHCEVVSISILPKEQGVDVEKASHRYIWEETVATSADVQNLKDAFKAGAAWQKEQTGKEGFTITDTRIALLAGLATDGENQLVRANLKSWFPTASCFKPAVTYKIGQRFEKEDEQFILAGAGHYAYLVSLVTGESYTGFHVRVMDLKAITLDEFTAITEGKPEHFTLIQPEP